MTGDRVGVGDTAAFETTEAADNPGVTGTDFAEVVVETVGLTGGDVTIALAFPLAPTVVQAPPT